MNTYISNFWHKISEIGIDETLVPSQRKIVRILNRIIFLNAIIAIIFSTIDLINKSYESSIISFCPFIVSCILLFLNKKQLFALTKWLTFSFIIIFISSITIITGKDSGFIIYFIPGILFPSILFQRKKIIIGFSSFVVLLLIVVFFMADSFEPIIKLTPKELIFHQISCLVGALLITFLIIWYFRSTNLEYEEIIINNNKDLTLYNSKINLQKIKLEAKNKDITDSINYASRIQQAILPSNQKIAKHFTNYFLLHLPKDILSGDFYWVEAVNNRIYLAVADCTGHGIPGSMVSVVCNNALNRSVQEFHLKDPNVILNKTRALVIEAFDDNEKTIRDGMDISLCCIDKTTNKLLFSGANNPIIIIRNNQLITLEADRQPIGKYSFGKPFTQQEITLTSDDIVYLYTDGFADQFGGERGKKYKSANLVKFFIKNSKLTLRNQKDALEEEFTNWKSDFDQIDDVCIMGFKI